MLSLSIKTLLVVLSVIATKKTKFCHACISSDFSSQSNSKKRQYLPVRTALPLEQTSSLLSKQKGKGEHPCNVLSPALLCQIRGGADEDDSFEFEEETDDFDDEDLFGLDDDIGDFDDIDDDEFDEDNTVEQIIEAYKKTPPLTKMYLTGSFLATLYGYIGNRNQFPSLLLLKYKETLTRLQLWRPITSFLNFGPFGLGYLMTAHFVWTYMSTLERLNHSNPYDFWIMILFGQLSMVLGYPLLKLSPRFLGHNLSTFLVYVWSRYHEGIEVNMFELFNTRAELLPWFFLAQTFLLEGEPPVLDFLGIVFGHIYYHFKTIGLLKAPAKLTSWYHKGDNPYAIFMREKYKRISSEFEMQ